jgi:outer membrane protein assembly factor BamE (lipoprotein component of BamABCDE complex)
MHPKLFGASLALAALALTATACSPTRDYHGFVADSEEATEVQVGVDTKATVTQRLGSPSTISPLDPSAWYYVSTVQERFAFYRPDTAERTVIAVRFDESDTVSAVDRYGVERGRIVAYNDNKTPTRGRELGVLEQIFGSIGRASPLPNTQDREGGPRRDR